MSTGRVLLILLGIFDAVLVGVLIRMARNDRRRSRTWSTLAEGRFDHAEYGEYPERRSRRSGAMVHTTTHYTVNMECTVVFFDDGRSFVLSGRRDMPFPKGGGVLIRENGNGHRVIESSEP